MHGHNISSTSDTYWGKFSRFLSENLNNVLDIIKKLFNFEVHESGSILKFDCHQLFIYHHLRWIVAWLVVCLQTLELILMWDSLIPAQAIITRPDSPNFKWAAGLSRNLQFFPFKFGQIRWANRFGFEESVLECFSCFYKYKSYSNVCTWVHFNWSSGRSL